jgi:hypothetical protein
MKIKKNKLISQLTSSIKKEDLEKLFPSFKKAGNKHKRIALIDNCNIL